MRRISPVFRQFITIVCCNLSSFSYGVLFGWATINFVELQSDETTFPAGRLTLEEATLVVSIVNIGGLIGNFAMLPISDKFGIKRTIHCLSIPLFLSSLLIIWAPNKYFLFVSRILSGFVGGCMIVGLPILTADIAFDKIRGTLNSMYDPSYNSGMLFSFLLGNHFNLIDQAKIQLIIPAILISALFFIPEAPGYYMTRNKKLKAIKSEKFFKGAHSVTEKIDFFMKQANENVEKGDEKNAKIDLNNKLTLSDFLTPQAKRAIFLSFTLLSCSFLSGALVIISYVTAIFVETGSTLSEKSSSLLISFVQLLTNLIFSNIVDRFNRKTLFVWSSVITAFIYSFYGLHCMLWTKLPNFEWVSPLCFSLIVLIGGFGIVPIPYIVTMEIFPHKIRNACVAPAMSLLWTILFFLGTAYPLIEAAIGLPACMFGFGGICLLSGIFGFYFMPETRGKSHDEIMELLGE